MITRSQYDLAERLLRRQDSSGWDSLSDSECVFLRVTSCVPFMECEDFGCLFDSGYCADAVAEAFNTIGHARAAATVRLAHRIYTTEPAASALQILGRAFRLMEGGIAAHLAAFQRRHRF